MFTTKLTAALAAGTTVVALAAGVAVAGGQTGGSPASARPPAQAPADAPSAPAPASGAPAPAETISARQTPTAATVPAAPRDPAEPAVAAVPVPGPASDSPPEPTPWRWSARNPHAPAFVARVVRCLRGHGVRYVEATAPERGDDRIGIALGGDGNDRASISRGLTFIDACERAAGVRG